MERTQFPGGPYFATATVRSAGGVGGLVAIEIEGSTENWIGASVDVQAVGQQPKEGDRGLVLFPNSARPREGGYWLGALQSRFSRRDSESGRATPLPPGANAVLSDGGKCGVMASDSSVVMTADGSQAVMTNNSFKVTRGTSYVAYEEDAFIVNLMDADAVKTKMRVGKSAVEVLSGGSFVVRSGGNVEFRQPGSFIVTGVNEGSDEKPLDLFKVKCSRAAIDAGAGSVNVGAGAINVKIGSSKMGSSGGAPGGGGDNSLAVEVIQGKIDVSAGLGDISVRSLDPSSKVKLVQGMLAVGPMSYLELGSTHAKLGGELSAGAVGSWLTLNRAGDATLEAFKSVSIKATTTEVSIEAMTELKLKGVVKAMIETAMAEFKADAMLSIKTAMLELKDATMVNFGPKMAIPGPTGPLCSLPMCVMTGSPHVGEKCVG